MNPLTNIRNTQKMNDRELELGIAGTKSSWHYQFRDSAWIFVGGLPYDLTEGDLLAVFSQYGEIVNLNLVRDKSTGKSKGFGFICFQDQRSTVLTVDNLNGMKVLGRTVRVDHCPEYKMPKENGEEDEETTRLRREGVAPKPIIINRSDSEEKEQVISRKAKKEKKKKKKKEKKQKKAKKKKRKSVSDSGDSESSESEYSAPPSPKKARKEEERKESKTSTRDANREHERYRDSEYRERDSHRDRETYTPREDRDSKRDQETYRPREDRDLHRDRHRDYEKSYDRDRPNDYERGRHRGDRDGARR